MSLLASNIRSITEHSVEGVVSKIRGLLVEVSGAQFTTGARLAIERFNRDDLLAEVIGFRDGYAMCLSFDQTEGIDMGARVRLLDRRKMVFPDYGWRGRVLNCFGQPIDNRGKLTYGCKGYSLLESPPLATLRKRVKVQLNTGIKAIDTFVPCCKGQRMAIFSGSGVGKSVLLGMLARHIKAERGQICVIGLIGERGREVNEFIEDELAHRQNTVVIVATSDESALRRRQAGYLTMAVSEYFRDQGADVVCMIDSLTRFAHAQREIGLAIGEPPTNRGYTPSVFSEMPRLLERAGMSADSGTITGLFSVLVEGDDYNEPVADMVKAIVDGHIILDRNIAERGRFPAVDILRSVSRTSILLDKIAPDGDRAVTGAINRAKKLAAIYRDMEELIRLGAYKHGSNPQVDDAITCHRQLEQFLAQGRDHRYDLEESYVKLINLVDKLSPQREHNDDTNMDYHKITDADDRPKWRDPKAAA